MDPYSQPYPQYNQFADPFAQPTGYDDPFEAPGHPPHYPPQYPHQYPPQYPPPYPPPHEQRGPKRGKKSSKKQKQTVVPVAYTNIILYDQTTNRPSHKVIYELDPRTSLIRQREGVPHKKNPNLPAPVPINVDSEPVRIPTLSYIPRYNTQHYVDQYNNPPLAILPPTPTPQQYLPQPEAYPMILPPPPPHNPGEIYAQPSYQ
eukprot:NODE_7460_length_776_cov_60.185299_g6849_i0.p1 GENE.NODE_7460_length_776_cov_60.185299_g6849_i0~~NODE_7460_length_776_cov_60.185299_g6849_i0.p1  ORF type:complete len:203 (+),score=42.99 NODE_7460_length_776_cov_60.185299_g6849_i0:54-662(+)